jgi:non-homologous end joining protein Ku
MQNTVMKLIPDFKENIYIKKYTTPFYQILLELIDKKISQEELEVIAQNFRRISTVNNI